MAVKIRRDNEQGTHPHGDIEVFTLRKNGTFYKQGDDIGGRRLSFGERIAYRNLDN